ncbi:tRNA epoxyqueuosine(34) reductase QueG [Pacificimonas flava]|uniref:Epoxyqueuosine reductase n=2 Tax=Pacificimonas TaxID=1960290 RepID=A0A219B2N9_9SPHN|nr:MULTISPECIES: tRNA epoxyqueuosine(34) reductase QueG [Pacificimonas]MBZ6377687.1 tRNA epoxyqueuosine(34) reductase QueG [Pacificimonas aurantium]OWV32632.1 tRNA epoxyqueuosine(34) reductase QueG [Pacificimonas flava]
MGDNKLLHDLRQQAEAAGFASLGICRADATPRAGPRLDRWLAEGMHGDMAWMVEKADRRRSPQDLWPDCRSVVILGMSYAPPVDPLRHHAQRGTGAVSVYAHGADYHNIVKKALKRVARWIVAERPDAEVKVFVDTAPVMEKPLAEAAGIGWQGKHTNLVSTSEGSWLFLGAIYTTLELPPDEPHGDRCGSCRRCQEACPTAAFPEPYRLDARRCLSYLTIEHSGPIPEEFRRAMGNRIYGCDDCLAVCPWNKFAETSRDLRFHPRRGLDDPDLADLARLDDDAFRELFSGSPVKRVGRERFVRNVAIALGNSGDPAARAALAPLVEDGSEVVREAAQWALAELDRQAAAA